MKTKVGFQRFINSSDLVSREKINEIVTESPDLMYDDKQ